MYVESLIKQNGLKQVTLQVAVDGGTDIMQIVAVDQDEGRNGKVSYYLSKSSDNFTIHTTTGYLRTKKKLPSSTYTVVVTATDQGIPPRSANTHVVVKVEEPSSANPIFMYPFYNFTILENKPFATFVGVANATFSGELSYRVKEYREAPFGINSKTGMILTRTSLDRERRQVYQFHVMATAGRVTATALITVTVLDVNDNQPVFVQEHYKVVSLSFLEWSYSFRHVLDKAKHVYLNLFCANFFMAQDSKKMCKTTSIFN